MQRTFTLTCLVFLAAACWQRQDHTITNPEWPHYTLSGYTVDLDDDAQAVPNTPVSLIADVLIYDVTFDFISIVSDSNGHYQFDTVYPGVYRITADRDSSLVLKETLNMNHTNRIYNLNLPASLHDKIAYSFYEENPGGPNPRITWGSGILWMMGSYKPNEESEPTDALFECSVDDGILGFSGHFPNPVPDATDFLYAQGLFYLITTGKVTVLSTDATFITEWVADEPMRGAAWADSVFWTTQGSRLQMRGKTLKTVAASYETQAEILSPLAYDGAHFWSYDQYRGLLLNLDAEGHILASYRPIDAETGGWIEVYDLDFQLPGRLWATDKQRRKLYRFQAR